MDQNEFEIEKKKLELEKVRIKANRVKFWVGTVALGIVTLVINFTIQNQKIEQEKIVQENLHLSKFVQHIIDKDATVRRDIAQYFSVLAFLESSRDKWKNYLTVTEELVAAAKLKEMEITNASQQRDSLSNLLLSLSDDSQISVHEKDSVYNVLEQELISKNKTIIEQQKQLSALRFDIEKEPIENPVWLDLALKEVGVQEITGPEHNPRIIQYANESGFDFVNDDETPWNSIFMNWVFVNSNYKGTGKANARSWLLWGKELTKPKKGCIVVLWRGSVNSWQGHVGLLLEETPDKIKLLSGNHYNGVTVGWLSKENILGYRWPL